MLDREGASSFAKARDVGILLLSRRRATPASSEWPS